MPNPYKEVEQRMFSPSFALHLLTHPLDLTIAELQRELLNEANHTSNTNSLHDTDGRPSGASLGIFFQKAIEVEDRL
jgi:hypothetical protein